MASRWMSRLVALMAVAIGIGVLSNAAPASAQPAMEPFRSDADLLEFLMEDGELAVDSGGFSMYPAPPPPPPPPPPNPPPLEPLLLELYDEALACEKLLIALENTAALNADCPMYQSGELPAVS